MPFESPDWPLEELLKDVKSGKVQLPDFQREWKWDDERIISLLGTIMQGYPIGVVMTLETGGVGVRFKPKPLAGVSTPATDLEPEQLLLDGQQRLTSLFQALMSKTAVDTTDARGKKLRRWYYIDVRRAVEDGVDDEGVIFSIPEDRVKHGDFGRSVVLDLSSMDAECAAGMFPLNMVFDSNQTFEWAWKFSEAGVERREIWKAFQDQVLKTALSYMVPVIKLTKTTPKEAVCTVFEKVNTGGVPLNVFELITATFAGDPSHFKEHGSDFRLNDYWREVQMRLSSHGVLRELESTEFLQVVTLLSTWDRRRRHSGEPRTAPGISCKRKDILKLTLAEFLRWAPKVTESLEWVAEFLGNEHIFTARDVPYRSQIVPLAAIRAAAGPDVSLYGADAKLRQWYWCGVLGELYGGTTETRFARDLEQVLAWLAGERRPSSVLEAVFRADRLYTLRTRNSAAYKGIYALLMRDGGRDWMKNQKLNLATFFQYKVDIHHIFPKVWCDKYEIDPMYRESIVNKTAISHQTNLRIGGKAPSTYLAVIERAAAISATDLDEVLRSHAIDPAHLRKSDFDSFFDARFEALLSLVESAMGKPVARGEDDDPDDPAEFEDERDDEEDPAPQLA